VSASLSSADAWLRPLDRARTALFVCALRVAPLRAVLVEKQRRIPALLLLHGAAAFALSLFSPTLLLMGGPLLLGVPHLLADFRYLVLRPDLPAAARSWLLGGAVVMLGLRMAELLGFAQLLRFELPLAALWVTGSAVLGAPRLRDPRLLLIAALALGFVGAAWTAPGTLRLVMAHAHNPVALAIWALVFCRTRRMALAVAVALGLAALLLVTSPLAWLGFKHGLQQCWGLHAFTAADELAPFVRSTSRALGVVASFAFLQSVHYAVWLHAVPQETTRGEGTLSFRMSFRALSAELGVGGLALAALLVVLVPLCGWIAPLRTQSAYLSLATFHGYLELGAVSLWWLGRRGTAA
jgi:hypothetical protein